VTYFTSLEAPECINNQIMSFTLLDLTLAVAILPSVTKASWRYLFCN